jgi:hypothetical protein
LQNLRLQIAPLFQSAICNLQSAISPDNPFTILVSFERRRQVKTRLLLTAVLGAMLCLAGQQATQGGDKKKHDNPFGKLPQPGPEHKLLAKLQGTWNAKVKSWFGPGEPKESTGVMVRKMILDGRYLHESFKGDFLGKEFLGRGVTGFDVNKKKYVMAWIDNFGTGISTSTGSYDKQNKTLTFTGEEDIPEMGGKTKTRDVLKIVSADEQLFEMYRTPIKVGKEFKVMEIVYTRKAK